MAIAHIGNYFHSSLLSPRPHCMNILTRCNDVASWWCFISRNGFALELGLWSQMDRCAFASASCHLRSLLSWACDKVKPYGMADI